MANPADFGSLRSQVDALTTSLMVSGPDAKVIEGLQRLSESAQRSDCPQVADLTLQLLRDIIADESASRDSLVQSALTKLQQALNHFSGEASLNAFTPGANSLAEDPELVGDFITEAREHLASVEVNMLTLERKPDEMEAIHAVFRGFHTIKGLAGFLDFLPVRDVAHEVETVLDLTRNDKLQITGAIVDTVLESVDYLKTAVEVVEERLRGKISQFKDNRQLIVRIQSIIRAEQPHSPESDIRGSSGSSSETASTDIVPPPETQQAIESKGADRSNLDADAQKTRSVEAASVRVHTSKLDYLMDMVGEMVITQSLIRHNPALGFIQSPKLAADFAQLARITGEVQRTTMGMRMITIGHVFQRSSRLVRDLSRKAGKQVQFEISGEETELDKTIAEELTDPLLHMVRNACDHGIEEPATRIAAGKNQTARIRLAAYHQGGQIVIEISDDGRGLDRDKIVAKALQRGLIENGAHLSEQEVFALIFEPGFSTAAQVTDLSGRGVGMDVVRKNIQKLRGRIEINSKPGEGTTFLLKLPLTLAIIEGLVVGVGVHRYIVPIYTVRELISPKPGTISTVHGRNEMAMVRDRVLPVVRLAKRFNVESKSADPMQGLLVVADCQAQSFCLFVDEVVGKQEVVIKSLGDTLKNIPGIAGGAILGDGRVGLILDLDGVFRG